MFYETSPNKENTHKLMHEKYGLKIFFEENLKIYLLNKKNKHHTHCFAVVDSTSN